MNLSIVVVSYNTRDVLRECLARLEMHYPESERIVVDSSSTDGTPEMVAQAFPGVQLVQVPNRGYAAAVNRGLALARGRYVVEMNADVYLNPGDLESLTAALEADPKAAFAGPTLTTPEGTLQSFGPLYALNYWRLHRPRPVAWISGALIMARREALEAIGGMDERFFFYNEDLEWCTRARRRGWRVLLVPRRVLHLGGASTPDDPRFLAEGYRGGLLYTALHYPWLHGLHRKAVWLEAQLRCRWDPLPRRREAYRLILDRLAQGDLQGPLVS